MPLNKAGGDMYDWITHTHTHLGGECQHKCAYCYVNALKARFPVCRERYSGELRLIEKELKVNYGEGKTIFIDDLNDLWAEGVPTEDIRAVLRHCREYQGNAYVFQTKNPSRYHEFVGLIPDKAALGCTIESNVRYGEISNAPNPKDRALAMATLPPGFTRFVTVEPILRFGIEGFLSMLSGIGADFVNIGADSKGHDLPEPSSADIEKFITGLRGLNIEIRTKRNLSRLLGT